MNLSQFSFLHVTGKKFSFSVFIIHIIILFFSCFIVKPSGRDYATVSFGQTDLPSLWQSSCSHKATTHFFLAGILKRAKERK